jgi:high-affinity nickel-transport protein
LKRSIPYFIAILLLHILGITLLVSAATVYPSLWGLAIIAYTLGMRHAFDIDHIAAIDNTVRKITEQKGNPVGVGFFFALGHSSVVFVMSLFIAISTRSAQNFLPFFQPFAKIIGPTVAGSFLIIIAIMNLFILKNLLDAMAHVRRGETHNALSHHLTGGAITRLAGPLFKMISKSWHLYPLGFLFGLGFDTASEIALLALSGGAASSEMPWMGVLALPILFASGMTLFDTLDSLFMSRAYSWAVEQPIRKLYYNLVMTVLSVVAALIVGVVLLSQVLSDNFNLSGGFWSWVSAVDFGNLGFVLVGVFVLVWLIAVVIWRKGRFGMGPSTATD